jgi:hypothetical protein
MEVIEICLHPNVFNKNSRFILSKAWLLLIIVLKQVKQHSNEQVQKDAGLRNTSWTEIGGGDNCGRGWAFQGDI